MTKPNLLIIGAQKAGTTSVMHYLAEHPHVFMLDEEVHYFAFNEQPNPYRMRSGNASKAQVLRWAEYLSLFDGATQKIIAEKSPSYLYYPNAAANIKQKLPDAQLIAILRNPIERAYSNYMHCINRGYEDLDFLAALDAEEQRIQKGWDPLYHYKHQGIYSEQIARFQTLFPNEQLQVYIFDDFKADPQAFMENLYENLGIDPSFKPDMDRQYNTATGRFNNAALQYVWDRTRPIHKPLKRLIPSQFKQGLKSQMVSYEAPDETAVAYLRDFYTPEIKHLEALLGRGLAHWLQS